LAAESLKRANKFKNSKKGQFAIRGDRATTVTAFKKEFDIQAPKKEKDLIIQDESEAVRIKKKERKTQLRENLVINYFLIFSGKAKINCFFLNNCKKAKLNFKTKIRCKISADCKIL